MPIERSSFSSLINQARIEIARAAYESASACFETIASNLQEYIKRGNASTISDQVEAKNVTQFISNELCAIASEILVALGALPKSEQSLLLCAAESACKVLWKLRGSANRNRICIIRYTLIRRLAACEEHERVVTQCWDYICELLDKKVNVNSFNASQVRQICRGEKIYVSIMVGVILNLLGSLVAQVEDRNSEITDKIMQISGVVFHVLESISGMPLDSVEKHVDGFATNSLLAIAYLGRSDSDCLDMISSKDYYCQVVVKCMEFFKADRLFVLSACNKMLKYRTLDQMQSTMEGVLNALRRFRSPDCILVCGQIAKHGIQTDNCLQSHNLLKMLYTEASPPWFIVVLLSALRIKIMSLGSQIAHPSSFLNELSSINRTFTFVLHTLNENEHLGLIRTYSLVAQGMHGLSNYYTSVDVCIWKQIAEEIFQFGSLSFKILESSDELNSEEQYQREDLSRICFSNMIMGVRLESQVCGALGCSVSPAFFSNLESLLDHEPRLNDVSARQAVHSTANDLLGLGLAHDAALLFEISFNCCLRVTRLLPKDVTEMQKRLHVLVQALLKSGRNDRALKIITDLAKNSKLTQVSLQHLLVQYADIIMYTSDNVELKSEVLPLVPQIQDSNSSPVFITKQLLEEFTFWTSHRMPVLVKHRLQGKLLNMAIDSVDDRSAQATIHLDDILQALQVALPRIPTQFQRCACNCCTFCGDENMRKMCALIEARLSNSFDELFVASASTELICHSALSIICADGEHGFRRAQTFINERLDIGKLQSMYTQLEERKQSDVWRIRISRMYSILREICFMFSVHGSTYLITELKMYVCSCTLNPVAAVLLAPARAPDLLTFSKTFELMKSDADENLSKACSLISLAAIEAERGRYSRAFSYVELGIPILRANRHLHLKHDLRESEFGANEYFSHKSDVFSSPNSKSGDSRVYHETVDNRENPILMKRPCCIPVWQLLGIYIHSLCMRATICAELGMYTSSLTAFDEAFKLTQSSKSVMLEIAIRVRRADVLQRFSKPQESLAELRDCLHSLLPLRDSKLPDYRRTLLDFHTYVYALAYASHLESSCLCSLGRLHEGFAARSRASEYISEVISCFKIRWTQKGFAIIGNEISYTVNHDGISLRTFFRLLWIRLSCLHLMTTQLADANKLLSCLDTMLSECRCYQPTVVGLILLCKIHIFFLEMDSGKVHFISHADPNNGAIHSDHITSLVSKFLRLVRDVPYALYQSQPLVMRVVLERLNTVPHSIVGMSQMYNGSLLRSQNLALLTRKCMARCIDLSVILDNQSSDLLNGQFSSALSALMISDHEIDRVCGKIISGGFREMLVCGFPVVTVTAQTDGIKCSNELILSRTCNGGRSAAYIKIHCEALCDILNDLGLAVLQPHETENPASSRESKIVWWENRLRLDSTIQNRLIELDSALGAWRVFFLGEFCDQHNEQAAKLLVSELERVAKMNGLSLITNVHGYASLLSQGIELITTTELTNALSALLISAEQDQMLNYSAPSAGNINQTLNTSITRLAVEIKEVVLANRPAHVRRGAILLSLDGYVKHIAWESIITLKHQRIYRTPSAAIGRATATLRAGMQEQNIMDVGKSYFVLNPTGDLLRTQRHLEPILRKSGWAGIQGRTPSSAEAIRALQEFECYLYFGHGSGQDFMQRLAIRDIFICAAAILMGCSSGVYDHLDSSATACTSVLYLFAGAPFVLGNLWDVTDKDIDRFSNSLLDEWFSKCSTRIATDDNCVSVAVQRARTACQLQYLVGAAPVLYGIPTSIWDSRFDHQRS